MSDATVRTSGERAAIRLERLLPDPPEVVWSAITDREQLRAWFPCDVLVEGGRWRVGAVITFPFPAEVIELTLTGEVLAVTEAELLCFSWGEEILRFELREEGQGTRLVLIDELSDAWAARNAAGWDDCLDRLYGTTPEPGAWGEHFASYAARFELALGAQEGPPAGYKGG